MAAAPEVRVHEVEFCGRIKSWMDAIIALHPEWPFERVAIEKFGRERTVAAQVWAAVNFPLDQPPGEVIISMELVDREPKRE
jgi:hypothetical protein